MDAYASWQGARDQVYKDSLINFVRVAKSAGNDRLEKKDSLLCKKYDVEPVSVKGELSDVVGVESLADERRLKNFLITTELTS